MTQKYEQASQKLPIKKIILNNLIGGLAWSIGATIGLSLIITILGIIAANIDVIPIIGSFISDIINFILKTNPNFKK